jgi:hypothetical protein
MTEIGKQVDDARTWKSIDSDRFAESLQWFAGPGIERREDEGRGNDVDDAA